MIILSFNWSGVVTFDVDRFTSIVVAVRASASVWTLSSPGMGF